MADDTLEFEVKRYLMKLISDKYKILRGQMYKAFGQTGYALAYNNIANKFMGGDFTNERELINEHKEKFAKKGYADYNYFDLDSLYPFLLYLDMLSTKIDEYASHNRRVIDRRVFDGALNDTIREFNRTKNTSASGYYKGYVTLSTKEGSDILNPIKTNNDKVDMTKANIYQKYIREYFEKKYERSHATPSQQLSIDNVKMSNIVEIENETNLDNVKVENNRSEEESYTEEFEIIRYKYRGKNLVLIIDKEEKFYSEEGFPVYRIQASSKYGRYFKTIDINENIYVGPLYNDEFEIVAGVEESGEEFIPSPALIKLVGVNKTHEKDPSKRSMKGDPENYTMFNDDREIID